MNVCQNPWPVQWFRQRLRILIKVTFLKHFALEVWVSIYMSAYLSVCVSGWLAGWLSVCVSLCVYVFHVCLCLCVCLCVCQLVSVCLFLYVFVCCVCFSILCVFVCDLLSVCLWLSVSVLLVSLFSLCVRLTGWLAGWLFVNKIQQLDQHEISWVVTIILIDLKVCISSKTLPIEILASISGIAKMVKLSYMLWNIICILETPKRYFDKQWRPTWNATNVAFYQGLHHLLRLTSFSQAHWPIW